MSESVIVLLVILLIFAGLWALYTGGFLELNLKNKENEDNPSGGSRGEITGGQTDDTTGGNVFGDSETQEGDFQDFPDGFVEAPVLPPRKKSLNEACVEQSECNRGLDCRVVNEAGDKQCRVRVNMEDLAGADQVQVPGTELGTISTGDKFMIRNRHKGRCLGKNDEDRLVHSEVGPNGQTIPCDAEDSNFQWENVNIPGTNKKKFRIVDTNLCLALNGRLNVTSQFPNGRWASQQNFSLVSCDRPNKATAIEVVPEPEESGIVEGQEFVPARYYALKTYSTEVAERPGTTPGCLWMPGWHPNNAQTSYIVTKCDRSSKNDTMHFNFPKIE